MKDMFKTMLANPIGTFVVGFAISAVGDSVANIIRAGADSWIKYKTVTANTK